MLSISYCGPAAQPFAIPAGSQKLEAKQMRTHFNGLHCTVRVSLGSAGCTKRPCTGFEITGQKAAPHLSTRCSPRRASRPSLMVQQIASWMCYTEALYCAGPSSCDVHSAIRSSARVEGSTPRPLSGLSMGCLGRAIGATVISKCSWSRQPMHFSQTAVNDNVKLLSGPQREDGSEQCILSGPDSAPPPKASSSGTRERECESGLPTRHLPIQSATRTASISQRLASIPATSTAHHAAMQSWSAEHLSGSSGRENGCEDLLRGSGQSPSRAERCRLLHLPIILSRRPSDDKSNVLITRTHLSALSSFSSANFLHTLSPGPRLAFNRVVHHCSL